MPYHIFSTSKYSLEAKICAARITGVMLSIFMLFWSTVINAMEFTKINMRTGIAIKATGPIEYGDANKLQLLAPEASVDEKGLRRILLESPGGNVAAAMQLAQVIRSNNFVTDVSGECASACAMVLYPAGRYFMLLDGGKLGFHSCYNTKTLSDMPECTEAIAKFAAGNGFPYGSIKVFASLAGPAEMHWVTNVLAHCYGMERLIGDPVPITVSTLCPAVSSALISANFREPDRPLGPSFDCNKAKDPAEFLLCRDSELMHLDALMGELYRMVRHRERGSSRQVLAAQRGWIVERDKRCNITSETIASYESSRNAARCISEMTMVRMHELLNENGTPVQDLSPVFDVLKK